MAKKKSARQSSVSKKKKGRSSASMKAAKRTTGRQRSVSARHGGAKKPRTSGHALVDVICSECFEEFAFDTGVKTDTLTCPVCEHSAARPDDGTLHRIESLRKAERTNFMIAAILLILAILGFVAWGVFALDPRNTIAPKDGTYWWGPLGSSLLFTFVLMIFMFKYEKNRWETYF